MPHVLAASIVSAPNRTDKDEPRAGASWTKTLLLREVRLVFAEELGGVAVPDQVLLVVGEAEVLKDARKALDVLVHLVGGAVGAPKISFSIATSLPMMPRSTA